MIARENTRPSLKNTREINTLQNTEKRKKQLEKYTRGKIVRKIYKRKNCQKNREKYSLQNTEEKNSLQNIEKRKKIVCKIQKRGKIQLAKYRKEEKYSLQNTEEEKKV